MKRELKLCLPALALVLLLPACGGPNGSDGAEKSPANQAASAAKPQEPGQPVVCPVCGLSFGVNEATASLEHEGKTYHFLLADHKEAFAADPASFLATPPPKGSLPTQPASK